jgi:hypothetical protein
MWLSALPGSWESHFTFTVIRNGMYLWRSCVHTSIIRFSFNFENYREKNVVQDEGWFQQRYPTRTVVFCSPCSFGNFPGVRSIKTDVSELNVGSIVLGDQDGTDIESRNVGFYTSDAGEIPKRTQTTFWTRRKSKNYHWHCCFRACISLRRSFIRNCGACVGYSKVLCEYCRVRRIEKDLEMPYILSAYSRSFWLASTKDRNGFGNALCIISMFQKFLIGEIIAQTATRFRNSATKANTYFLRGPVLVEFCASRNSV